MAILARLGVVLGLDSAEFQQGIAAANKKLAEFAAKIPTVGAAGATAFAGMAYEAMQFADELSDTAKANDVAIASILKLQNALMLSGGEAENAGKMLSSFTQFIDKAASGNDEAQKTFAKMGISLKELETLSNEELFNKYVDSLSKIDDTVTRNAKAMDAFGKSVKGVDIVGFNEELHNGLTLTEQQTQSIKDAADAWDIMHKIVHETMVTFTEFIGTPMLRAMEFLESLPKQLNEVSIAFEHLGDTISLVNNLTAALIMRDVDYLKKTLEDYQRIKAQIDAERNAGNAKPSESNNGAPSDNTRKRIVLPSKEAKKIDQDLKMAQLVSVEYERHLKYNLANLKTQGDMLYMTENQKKVQEAINRVNDETDKQLSEIAKKKEQAEAHGADPKVIAELDNQKKLVQQLGDQYAELTRQEVEGQIAAQQTFEYGWQQAFKQYAEDANNAALVSQQMFTSVTGNMSAAIDNFVRTGKFSFKDFARSIIQDLIAIQMKAQAMQMFSSLFSVGTAIKYGTNIGSQQTSMLAAQEAGMFRATGGMVNGPAIVGENGPELFIPQTSGTVIPNQQLSSAFGSQPQVVYNGPYIANMQAIDTQSATQFLAKNKTAVYAANQSAARGMPTSR